MKNILVTGGLGFIGVNLLKHLARNPNLFIHNVDNLNHGVRTDCQSSSRGCILIDDAVHRLGIDRSICI